MQKNKQNEICVLQKIFKDFAYYVIQCIYYQLIKDPKLEAGLHILYFDI